MSDNVSAALNTPTAPEVTEAKQEPIDSKNLDGALGAELTAADAALAEAAKKVAEAPKKEEPKSSKKKYKIKVDKNEEEFEFDPTNDEEVVKHLQMSRASQKRMSEAAELRKVALEFIDQLKKDPRKVLSDPTIGVDIKKLAQEIINDEIKELEKSPEQREKDKLLKEVEELKKQAKEKEDNFKKTEFARMQAEQEKYLESEISAALDVGGVPKTPKTVARMAEMMMIAIQNGIDLGPKDVVGLVKNNTMSEFKEIIGALSDDQLEDFLGKEVLGRLRKKNASKAKTAIQTASQLKSIGQKTAKEQPVAEKKMTIKQLLGV